MDLHINIRTLSHIYHMHYHIYSNLLILSLFINSNWNGRTHKILGKLNTYGKVTGMAEGTTGINSKAIGSCKAINSII